MKIQLKIFLMIVVSGFALSILSSFCIYGYYETVKHLDRSWLIFALFVPVGLSACIPLMLNRIGMSGTFAAYLFTLSECGSGIPYTLITLVVLAMIPIAYFCGIVIGLICKSNAMAMKQVFAIFLVYASIVHPLRFLFFYDAFKPVVAICMYLFGYFLGERITNTSLFKKNEHRFEL